MATQRKPGPLNSLGVNDIDTGTLCRNRSHAPGPTGTDLHAKTYSYSISGNPGAVCGMFFTEAQNRLKGTWYDYTDRMNQLRQNEERLGSSKYADAEFRQLAGRTTANLKTPMRTDVDIFTHKEGVVETILVRGCRGSRQLRFDLDEIKKRKLPKGVEPFQPFHDATNQLIALVLEVRGA